MVRKGSRVQFPWAAPSFGFANPIARYRSDAALNFVADEWGNYRNNILIFDRKTIRPHHPHMTFLDAETAASGTPPIPSIEDLRLLTTEEAAAALMLIPDDRIFRIGEEVGRQALSYQIWGGMAALVTGFQGNVRAVQQATETNRRTAMDLKALEELFLREYDRRRRLRAEARAQT